MGHINLLRNFCEHMEHRAACGWKPETATGDPIDMALFAAWNWAAQYEKMGPVPPPPRPPAQEPVTTTAATETSTQPEPEPAMAAEPAQDTAVLDQREEERKKALRWVHGLARARGLSHDDLSDLLCWGFGKESLAELYAPDLERAAPLLKALDLADLKQAWSEMPDTKEARQPLASLKDYLKQWHEEQKNKPKPPPAPEATAYANCSLEPGLCDGPDCRQLIYWAKTNIKKVRVPLNPPEPRDLYPPEGCTDKPEKRYVEAEEGEVRLVDTWPDSGDEEGGVLAYSAHHWTCPNADRFRKKKKK